MATKNQTISTLLALAATACFGIDECALKHLSGDVSIWLSLTIRFLFTGYIYFVLLSTTREEHICFSPRNIDWIIWVRAISTVLSFSLLAISLTRLPSQALAYVFFFVSPIFHVAFYRAWKKKFPENTGLLLITLITSLIGAFLYARYSLDSSVTGFLEKLLYDWKAHVCSLVSGFFYAANNEISDYIQDNCAEGHFKFTGPDRVDSVSSLRINAYTALAGAFLLPIIIPFAKLGSYWIGIDETMALAMPENSSNIVLSVFACAFIAAGSWLSTSAFLRSKVTAKTAAVDYSILPIAYLLGLMFDQNEKAPHFGAGLLVSMLIIMVGAVVYPLAEEKIRSLMRKS